MFCSYLGNQQISTLHLWPPIYSRNRSSLFMLAVKSKRSIQAISEVGFASSGNDVDLVFKSGKKQQDADCLSRSPLPEIKETSEDIPFLNNMTNFKDEQSKDPKVADIREEMDRSVDSTNFKEFNGI
ncbi:hypothetical protein AVEN_66448-1 [Araneus ventricosus]|uniref:Uncharacterized protein n=1 Tax=Araneus ventricosus TaxID=182803 RepID=A0A4Y2VJ26_ARAVE|nr:hypothetical protein AVEN_66448-1 [Araneus ventricosus]